METNQKKTILTKKGLGLGIYAQFLQLATGRLPLSPKVNVKHLNKTANTFAFDTVTTLAFKPTQKYVEEAVKALAVQTQLREPRQKFIFVSELFIITGIKLIKGAKIKYLTLQSTTVKGNLGINVTALGRTFSPKGYQTSINNNTIESNHESEFIFTFRVKRLKFRRRLKLTEYNKGAFITVSGKKDNNKYILVKDVDRANIKTTKTIPNITENGNIYYVPA